MSTLQPQAPGIPAPVPTERSAPYWEGCQQGELRYQRCASCGSTTLGVAVACGRCLGSALRWEVSGGEGRLYSWTVVWRPQHPSFEVPYAPAIIELDEGFWLVSA